MGSHPGSQIWKQEWFGIMYGLEKRETCSICQGLQCSPLFMNQGCYSADSYMTYAHNISMYIHMFLFPIGILPLPWSAINLGDLEDKQHYEDWASQMAMVFDAMSVFDIVVNGLQPSAKASPS